MNLPIHECNKYTIYTWEWMQTVSKCYWQKYGITWQMKRLKVLYFHRKKSWYTLGNFLRHQWTLDELQIMRFVSTQNERIRRLAGSGSNDTKNKTFFQDEGGLKNGFWDHRRLNLTYSLVYSHNTCLSNFLIHH